MLVTDLATTALFVAPAALGVRAASAVTATRAVDARRATRRPRPVCPAAGGQVTRLLDAAVAVPQSRSGGVSLTPGRYPLTGVQGGDHRTAGGLHRPGPGGS